MQPHLMHNPLMRSMLTWKAGRMMVVEAVVTQIHVFLIVMIHAVEDLE